MSIYLRKSGVDKDMQHKLLIDSWCKRIGIDNVVFSGYMLKVIQILQEDKK